MKRICEKGFILNEGPISMGNPFIVEGLKGEPDKGKRTSAPRKGQIV